LRSIGTVERTTADSDTEPLHPRLEELLASGADEEQEVLHQILRSGVDQGCFCRPGDDDLLTPSHGELQRFLDAAEDRPDVALTEEDPWAVTELPTSGIEADEPGWVVLPQRCDLVRCYRREPLVEVARGRLITEPGEARAARLNSPRWVAFADGPGKSSWAADLRHRAVIAKHRLLDQPDLVQPIPDSRRRKQFRLRLGQRYWRDPVPTDLVETLQRPLVKVLTRSASRTALTEKFVALLGLRVDDGQVVVAAVLDAQADRREAEDEWREIVDLLTEHEAEAAALIEPEESGVYDVNDLSLGYWLDAFKFDLDEVTYGKKAAGDQAEPAA
jgi:hypothetical protein